MIKASVYALGSQAPSLPRDPGAGAWNAKSATVGMRALKQALTSISFQVLASCFGGDDAVKHLMHYLSNTGRDYTIDFQGLINEVQIATDAYNAQVDAAKLFVSTLPDGCHQFTSSTGSLNHVITQAASKNWFFAVASYSTWGSGTATVQRVGGHLEYTIEYECHFVDRYNWDGGKEVQIPIPGYGSLPAPMKKAIDEIANVNAGQLKVTDEFMAEFHRQGLAKEFEMVGTVKKTISHPVTRIMPTPAKATPSSSALKR